jgi:CheY-like chemotaxis protein/nitrogen-specific signal transduction histidine kinase
MKEHRFELADTMDAEPRWYNSILQPVRDDDGQVRGIMRVSVDVSEAVTASRAKDQFMAMLGHELRNPLSPIVTAVSLMRLHGVESKEQEIIERQVGHLTRLVDDLLDISRITRGAIELKKERIELSQLVERAVETVLPMIEQRKQRLTVEVPRGIVLRADPDRFVQIISNLLTNASKYSQPEARIEVRGERKGERVRLAVKDEGIGIAPDMVERIFELFVQQAQSIERSKGGLGLGLAIVKSLVQLHGGTVSAKSAGLGRGSEFVVEMDVAPRPTQRSESRARALTRLPRAEPRKILVVDDNDDLANTLARALVALGHQVEVAYDGPTALQTAARFEPDIALLDIGLPVMDGYELARRLREEQQRAMHLIAVTGYGQQRDREMAEAAGFERHLVKPVDLANLQRVVAELSPSPDA